MRSILLYFTATLSIILFIACSSNPTSPYNTPPDDFSVLLDTKLSIGRVCWSQAGRPDILQDSIRSDGTCNWYNPYQGEKIRYIWPGIVLENASYNIDWEDEVDILTIKQYPANAGTISYSGIMRALETRDRDQSAAKYLEVWLTGTQGNLTIDLGQISEDIIPNGILDSEDRNHNGKMDEDEDIGLDGIPTGSPGDTDDDYYYSFGSNDYSHINGTEGNNLAYPRLYYIDTEDINRNGILDTINAYFTASINLADSGGYLVAESFKDMPQPMFYYDPELDYKLYRIPLWSITTNTLTTTGNPQSSNIDFIRLWMTNASDSMKISIAAIGFSNSDSLNISHYWPE